MSPPVAPPTSRVREFLWRLLPISRGRETFASVRVLSAECRKRGSQLPVASSRVLGPCPQLGRARAVGC